MEWYPQRIEFGTVSWVSFRSLTTEPNLYGLYRLHGLHYSKIAEIVNTNFMDYTIYMAKQSKKPLNMNIDEALLDRIDKYRFKRMFPTRSEAIEYLLDHALKANPARPESGSKLAPTKGE